MVVDVRDISVRYIVGDFRDIGLKEYVIQKIKGQYHVQEFWAVNNVSFSLEKGDFLGIVGTNGAGKSTLLKTISGILRPQKGQYRTEGNIVALLELGTGFDGDLTLRENIYLRGALLGMEEKFMDDTCDEILEFAELKEYENRKYKQLSSGMRSRLAFSISCLVQPDILILDEVLSVGDGAFREKSEKKMFEIINGGATTLFVSHSMAQVDRLANKVLWLDHGKQVAFGPKDEILPQYKKFLEEKNGKKPAPKKPGARKPAAKKPAPKPKEEASAAQDTAAAEAKSE
ncbi:MAG: ABC transporter ATP-binding protein [Ruminococcus sp.]|nr:ABC transporter ATP-binding protein [Ruminococcus sp.]MBQ8904832.1 ABC transporter ATP-binding protein [Ruminococcus sp.]